MQQGINILTIQEQVSMWTIHTPRKLMTNCATPMPIKVEHFASPMVHPIPGKMISSCKKLMHDPETAEVWQTAFGKDFGGMAQGCNKTGQKGTNTMSVMTHEKIRHALAAKTFFTHQKPRCQLLATKGQSTSHPHPSQGQLDHARWRHIHLHGWHRHSKTALEQCDQHKRGKFNVPWRKKLLPHAIAQIPRVHVYSTVVIPIVQPHEIGVRWMGTHKDGKSSVRLTASGYPGQQTALT
jgi:hypothetical protein